MNFRLMILQVCNVNFGNYFTLLPSLPCQYQKIIESYQPTYQKHHKIALKKLWFFYKYGWKFPKGAFIREGRLLQQIR